MKVNGGYILLSRKIDSSDVMRMPPATREIWFYILRKVNHTDYKNLKRGENIFSYKDIQDDLCWHVGYRKEKYSKSDIAKSLRRLCEGNMIETMRATRGVIIKVLQYDVYQDPKNYEGNTKETMKAPRRKRSASTIYKKKKKNKNVTNNIYDSFIEKFNEIVATGYKGDERSKRQFSARIKDGYTLDDFIKAITNASKNKYLMGENDANKRYLTPEYITRPDKLEDWINQKPKDKWAGYK